MGWRRRKEERSEEQGETASNIYMPARSSGTGRE
jgi:hypothetical protein